MLKETYFQVKSTDEVMFGIVDNDDKLVTFHLMMFRSDMQQTIAVSLVSDGFMKTHIVGYDGTAQNVIFEDIGGIEGRNAEITIEKDTTIIHVY